MKRLSVLIFILILAVLPLSGCDCSGEGGGGLSKTPQEEYSRLYSLATNGVTFNFEEQPTFSIEAVGTFSGEGLTESINMESLYSHDYRDKDKRQSYSYSKSVNTIFWNQEGSSPYYDEQEFGFQLSPQDKAYRYLTSNRPQDGDKPWSYPNAFGNGDYSDLFSASVFSECADRLVREGTRLFNPDFLENFNGDKSGGRYVLDASVKAENIADFAQWLNSFFPLFYLKDNLNADREWKFFDLEKEGAVYAGKIEIKSTARMLEEVAVTFDTYGDDRTQLKQFTFSARASFKSGGVTVKRLSALTA